MNKSSRSLYGMFLSSSIITGCLSVLIGLLLAYQSSRQSLSAQEVAKDQNYAAVVSSMVTPAFEISAYREIQGILQRLNNNFYEHAVVDSSGEIILADFTTYSMMRAVIPQKAGLRCSDLPEKAEFRFSEPAKVICTPLVAHANDHGKISDQGLMVIFRDMPKESFSRGQFLFVSFALILTVVISISILQLLAKKRVVLPLSELIAEVERAKVAKHFDLDKMKMDRLPGEYHTIIEHFHALYQLLEAEQVNKTRLEKDAARVQLATQVAHDIRSPLAAINAIESDLVLLPENTRVMLRSAINRIRDIANGLISKSRSAGDDTLVPQSKLGSEFDQPLVDVMLSGLIEEIVSEKRNQYRDKIGLEITFLQNQESYGLFVNVQPIEFKRALSNLINNSVESTGLDGKVWVTISSTPDSSIICVTDNGKGIPGSILPLLAKRGASYGKENGSGLGLYHAKTVTESWRGSLNVNSEVGRGTSVKMVLPRREAPPWFVDHLVVKKDMTVVVLDDDSSIHRVWNDRFSTYLSANNGLKLLHFSNPRRLEEHIGTISIEERKSCLFLIDYELLGFQCTGLDIIEKLDIGKQSILVSSRFEEPLVRSRCDKLEVRLIPKPMAAFVPITICAQSMWSSSQLTF